MVFNETQRLEIDKRGRKILLFFLGGKKDGETYVCMQSFLFILKYP